MAAKKRLPKISKAQPYVPVTEDPRTELKRLVKLHKALTKRAVAVNNMSTDKVDRETGEVMTCPLPADVIVTMHAARDQMKKEADHLQTPMLRELRKQRIYTDFLEGVFGVGPIIGAYLTSEIQIDRAVKVSNLRRYCGLAVIDGRLERRSGAPKLLGGTGTYNDEIRTRLYQMFSAMRTNAAKRTSCPDHKGKENKEASARCAACLSTEFPFGCTNKYLEVWKNVKHRQSQVEGSKTSGDKKGWHKAADVFIEDLYIIWRAIEGLPVWPSYYAAKLGYNHGGSIAVNAPKMMTVEEALETVGFCGKVPAAQPIDESIEEELEEDIAAE